MNRQEQVSAIQERVKVLNVEITEQQILGTVVMGYLNELKTLGLIEQGFSITEKGQQALDICKEFDVKLTNEELAFLLSGIVQDPAELEVLFTLVFLLINDREFLLTEYKKLLGSNPTPSDNNDKNDNNNVTSN